MPRKTKIFVRGTLIVLVLMAIAISVDYYYKSNEYNYDTSSLKIKAALFSHEILKESIGNKKISFDEINDTTAKFNDQKEEYVVESDYYLPTKKGNELKFAYFMYVKYHPRLDYWEKVSLDSYRMN